jgi:glucokinase
VRQIALADIGGTHARFALAELNGRRIERISEPIILKTSEHGSFEGTWAEFVRQAAIDPPKELAMAFAGPVTGDVLKLTNNPWVIEPGLLRTSLGMEQYTIVNDFGAVAHAVATLGPEHFQHVCGPETPLPPHGIISIIGPGTGLGVAALLRTGDGYEVIETEGGHVDFAPLDVLEDRMLVELRRSFGRVSVERVASGPGLWNLYEALGQIEDQPLTLRDEEQLWEAALAESDSLAIAALDRLCLTLGAVAGDMALAQGASAVVLAGGVGLRLAEYLPRSGFRDRFIAKGRFEERMSELPVKLITHSQPGLVGAAAAFTREHL